jgi:hypothetical protein
VPIENLQTKADLQRFLDQSLPPNLPTLIRQLQGASKIPLPYSADWGDFGGGHEAGTYSKLGRLVVLQGLVKMTGGTGQVIATLPAGFRPTELLLFPAVVDPTGAGSGVFGRVNVEADGDILPFGTTMTVGDWISLSGITFLVDA